MNTLADVKNKYTVFDSRITTYCRYQGCHWSVPILDELEGTWLTASSKIIDLEGNEYGLPYRAVVIKRNALGFIEAEFYDQDYAMEAMIEKILRDGDLE